ncbi:YhgE/Pip domain-containing protein [Kitasatospora sp. NBC_01287]|uniref:YhgE/Pip domain-containing protein n=1 Tax=Kitasatospora sp. NBC_01287 TaxID=2903573 RepID=UPI0022592DA0|nr:YhgE/Pip domain-containing protein [Kitasatospora sp. NBC_01287]MCX4744931.1 YhgE/Pip domain-containing protein [Kitasatospora sp. NBC_01287]
MIAVRLAFLELRRFRGPLRRTVPLLLCLIPLLYGAMYLWANWDPYGKTDRIPVAVVDLDRPATTAQGQLVDAGDQLVQQLKASGTFGWRFVDQGTAAAGLREGRFAFTIEIPADFSSRLASGSDVQPQQAGIRMELNDANNYIAGVMTEVVQSQLADQIDSATHEAYVRSLYGELSQVRDKLTTASDGAHQLVTATATAQQGSAALSAGGDAVHTGSTQLASGAAQISQAISTLDSAAKTLDSAAADQLPSTASSLVTAASLAAQGLDAVHQGTGLAVQGTTLVVTDLQQVAAAHPELAQDAAFQRALQDAQRADDAAGKLDGQAATADGNAHQALQDAQDLQRHIGALQQQVLGLQTPLSQIDSGAQGVATGAAGVSSGLGTLQQGASALQSAAGQAHDGATSLSGTVDDELKQIPVLSDQQAASAAQVLGSPVRIDRQNLHPAGVYGRGLAPFFFGIALWVFGLFAYLLLRPVNRRALAGRTRAAGVAVGGWLPAALLGAVAALLLYAVVDQALGLHPVHPLATVALLVLAAGSFVAVDHFLRTSLGVAGDVLSLVLLILQLTASGGLYPMATAPAFFQFLHPLLPMTYLVDGLRVTISGGLTGHLVRDLVVLAGFALAFLALSTLSVRRQRVWTVARLHPDIEL